MATLSKFLVERLCSAGIKTSFGVPGDYILSFYDYLSKKIPVVGCTNEAAAGFAADAYARLHGMGCCCVTYGVGGFNVINSVACAFAEKSPMVVISGSPGLNERGDKFLLHHLAGHFDAQAEMFKRITCASAVLNDMDTAGYEIDRVLTDCKYHKQPVYIEIPRDMVDKSIRYDPYSRGTPSMPKSDPTILKEALADVSEWVSKAKNPVVWAGVEIARHGLGSKLMDWAEQNQIPVATTILGKGTINESHPCSLGVYCEAISTEEIKKYFADSDCVIMLGVMMTDMNLGFMPIKSKRQNSINAATGTMQVRNHSYPEIIFSEFVEGFLKIKTSNRPKLEISKAQPIIPEASPDGKINSVRLFNRINSFLTNKSIVISDVGDSLFGAMDLKIKETNHFLCDAFYASMGFSIPAAVGAFCASPSSIPVVFVGDGAFQMTGQEVSTLVRLKCPATIFVMNNGGYATERLIMDGTFNDIANWDYAKVAESYGAIGIKCCTETDLENALNVAKFSKERPVVIEINLPKGDCSSSLKRLFKNKYPATK